MRIFITLLALLILFNPAAPASYNWRALLEELHVRTRGIMCNIIFIELTCVFYHLGMQRLEENEGLNAEIAGPLWTISSRDAGLADHIKSKVISLYNGDANSGLEHIYQKHRDSFHFLAGVNTKKDISQYIHDTMVRYPVTRVKPSGTTKVQAVYKVKAKAYLYVVVRSKDGYIVTSYMNKK